MVPKTGRAFFDAPQTIRKWANAPFRAGGDQPARSSFYRPKFKVGSLRRMDSLAPIFLEHVVDHLLDLGVAWRVVSGKYLAVCPTPRPMREQHPWPEPLEKIAQSCSKTSHLGHSLLPKHTPGWQHRHYPVAVKWTPCPFGVIAQGFGVPRAGVVRRPAL
jgi:hypothetical protein